MSKSRSVITRGGDRRKNARIANRNREIVVVCVRPTRTQSGVTNMASDRGYSARLGRFRQLMARKVSIDRVRKRAKCGNAYGSSKGLYHLKNEKMFLIFSSFSCNIGNGVISVQ